MKQQCASSANVWFPLWKDMLNLRHISPGGSAGSNHNVKLEQIH